MTNKTVVVIPEATTNKPINPIIIFVFIVQPTLEAPFDIKLFFPTKCAILFFGSGENDNWLSGNVCFVSNACSVGGESTKFNL